jgi:hypothetical protein
MGRPTDWHVLDPVPGDPYEVKELARKLVAFADDVAGALRSVRGLDGDTVIQQWAGLSGDEYRRQFGDLPGGLDQPPHVHVRPHENPRNGQLPGVEEHYYYDPALGKPADQ